MPNINDAIGIANGKIGVAKTNEFTNTSARDTYFTSNPSELVEGMYIAVGTMLQKREGGVWKDATPYIKGDAFKYSDFTPEQLASLHGDDGFSVIYANVSLPQETVTISTNLATTKLIIPNGYTIKKNDIIQSMNGNQFTVTNVSSALENISVSFLSNISGADGDENIKNISDYSLPTGGTTQQFIQALDALNLTPPTVLLGGVQFIDESFTLSYGELQVNIIEGIFKTVYDFILTSSDTAPYLWKYDFDNEVWVSVGGSGGTSYHNSLSNLDYNSSGHTGFASTDDLSTETLDRQNVDTALQNNITSVDTDQKGIIIEATFSSASQIAAWVVNHKSQLRQGSILRTLNDDPDFIANWNMETGDWETVPIDNLHASKIDTKINLVDYTQQDFNQSISNKIDNTNTSIETLTTNLNDDIVALQTADTNLQTQIDNNDTSLKNDIATLGTNKADISYVDTQDATLQTDINAVRAIALNKNVAKSFTTVADMNDWLDVPENVATLFVGYKFLIEAIGEPNYIWNGTAAVEDKAEIDLSDYYKKTETMSTVEITTADTSILNNAKDFTTAENAKKQNLLVEGQNIVLIDNPDGTTTIASQNTVPSTNVTAAIYMNSATTLSQSKPTGTFNQTFPLTTAGTAVTRTFTYTAPSVSEISATALYGAWLYFSSLRAQQDYSVVVKWSKGAVDISQGNYLFETGNQQISGLIYIPMPVNLLSANIPLAIGDILTFSVSIVRQGGTSHTVTLSSTPAFITTLLRNGGDVSTANVYDYNGADVATQYTRNRVYENDIALKQHITDNTLTTTSKDIVPAINEINSNFLTANADIYVSETGNDTTGDGTSGKPFATIGKAVNVLRKVPYGYQRNIRLSGNINEYAVVGISCNIIFDTGAKITGGLNMTTPYGNDPIRVTLLGIVNIEKSALTTGAAIFYAQRGAFIQFETVGTHIINGVDKSKIAISALSGANITINGVNVNVQVDNCTTAINCAESNILLYNVSGTNNTTAFSVRGGKVTYNVATISATNFKSTSDGGELRNGSDIADKILVNRDMVNGADLYNLTSGTYNISGGAIPASLLNQGTNSPIMAGSLIINCINGYTSTPTNTNFCYQQHTLYTITGEVYERAIYSQGTAGTVIDNGWVTMTPHKYSSPAVTNFNLLVNSGNYYLLGVPSSFTNAPVLSGTSSTGYFINVQRFSSTAQVLQECTIYYSSSGVDRSRKFTRQQIDGTWYPWKEYLIAPSYSTTETFTGGYWIDGKPIYRKVIDCGALPNTTAKAIPLGISNIDTIINYYGTSSSSTFQLQLPHVDFDGNSVTFVIQNKTSLILQTEKDRSAWTQTYVTIEYTKTV